MLKPIIDEAKMKKIAKRIQDSKNSYRSPDKSYNDIDIKTKSYTANQYDQLYHQ